MLACRCVFLPLRNIFIFCWVLKAVEAWASAFRESYAVARPPTLMNLARPKRETYPDNAYRVDCEDSFFSSGIASALAARAFDYGRLTLYSPAFSLLTQFSISERDIKPERCGLANFCCGDMLLLWLDLALLWKSFFNEFILTSVSGVLSILLRSTLALSAFNFFGIVFKS